VRPQRRRCLRSPPARAHARVRRSSPAPSPYAPNSQLFAEESGGVRLPLFFWLDLQHIREASRVRCPPQFVPSTGGGGFLRFPLTWDDPRLGACAHERAVTYLHMPRLWWPLASRTQPSGAPPVRTPQGPTAEGGHASCQAQLASPRICIQQSRSRGSETNPPVAPGRVASSARQIKVG
jgi:hypothetical protein